MFRAFTENECGGFKQGFAVSKPQSAGKKPLAVSVPRFARFTQFERDKQPVKRAHLCHKLCQQNRAVSRRIAAGKSESIPIRNRRVLAKDPILLSLRQIFPPVSRLGTDPSLAVYAAHKSRLVRRKTVEDTRKKLPRRAIAPRDGMNRRAATARRILFRPPRALNPRAAITAPQSPRDGLNRRAATAPHTL